MQSMVDVVVGKYMRPAQATEFMEYLLRLALYDLEEAWMDECASIEGELTKERRLTENLRSEQLELRNVWTKTLGDQQLKVQEHIIRSDALEAEITRLKGQMQEQEQAVKAAKTRDDLLRLYNTEAP